MGLPILENYYLVNFSFSVIYYADDTKEKMGPRKDEGIY